ncbi:MAG: hypothetical protein QOD86_1224 [Miltoncostaeaceae bacterium]|jgi:hypothetical protein|nr:hypothetical protein [Miltoncostaeaceae bacterium]
MPRRIERRSLRALGVGTAAAAALFIVGGQTALAGEDVRLDFSAAIPGTQVDSLGQGTGFTTKMGGDGDTTSVINPASFTLNPALSALSLTSGTGDAARPAAQGSSNQENAISVHVDPSAGPYKIETTLLAPWGALTQKDQSFGIYIGTSQQQYVKAVMQFVSNPAALPVPINEPRPRMFYENAPSGATWATKGGLLSLPTAQRVKLQLVVNPATGDVRGYVSTNDGILTPIHNADTPVQIPSLADPNATNVTAGLISHNPPEATAVTGTFDNFIVDVPSKLISISPTTGLKDVAADGNITVSFDQAVDPGSASGGISLTGPGGPVAGTVTLSADGKVATFDPAANLAAGGSYTVNVATSVTDTTGNPLLNGGTSTFQVKGVGGTTTTPTNTNTTNPPPPPVKPAYCAKFPKINSTLNKQIKAAKKARAKATTKAKRAAQAKKIKRLQTAQKTHIKKFKAICRVGSAR